MPLFCIDRSPNLAALPRSPQRVVRFAGIVGAGSMLVLVSVMVTGGNGVDGASNADAESSTTPLAAGPVASSAQLISVTPLVAVTPVVTDAITTTTLAPLVCTNSYTVTAGDFWVRIAQRGSIMTSELLAANRATKDTPLYPDRVICLPDGVNVVVPTTPATTPATIKPTPTTTPRAAPVATTPVTTSRSST